MAKLYVRVNLLIEVEVDQDMLRDDAGKPAARKRAAKRLYDQIWDILHSDGIFVYSGKVRVAKEPPKEEEQP